MAIDAGTAAIIGVGGTTTAALLGVMANLRLGRETASVTRAQLERQVAVDEDQETDKAFVRLERENERLTQSLAGEREAHQQTRASLHQALEENAQLRAENGVLSIQLVKPAAAKRSPRKSTPRKRNGSSR